jgi:hypothetical protein
VDELACLVSMKPCSPFRRRLCTLTLGIPLVLEPSCRDTEFRLQRGCLGFSSSPRPLLGLAAPSAGSCPVRPIETCKRRIESCARGSERCTRFDGRPNHFRDPARRSGRDGATVRLQPRALPFLLPLPTQCRAWGLTREERWRRTRPRSRGSESRPFPNGSARVATRSLCHRRARPLGRFP